MILPLLTTAAINLFKRKQTGRECLVFCNMGIGNFVMMIPAINALQGRYNLTFTTESQPIIHLIRMLYKTEPKRLKHIHGKFDFCVCNFMNQNRRNVFKILQLRIPYRIGQNCKGFNKWAMFFNQSVKVDSETYEIVSNLNMIGHASHMKKIKNKCIGNYIVIQADSSFDRSKNYSNYMQVIKELSNKYRIYLLGNSDERILLEKYCINDNIQIKNTAYFPHAFDIIKNARLFIGNDSGLGHIAYLCQTPSIIVWMKTESINRCRNTGERVINLYRPHYQNIIDIAYGILD